MAGAQRNVSKHVHICEYISLQFIIACAHDHCLHTNTAVGMNLVAPE